MKKNIGIISILLVIVIVIISVILLTNKIRNNQVNAINNDNGIAIMVPNNSGTYELYDGNAWPTDRYVFKEAKCQGESKVYWDTNTSTIYLTGNNSDGCTVYFDEMLLTDYIQSLYVKDGINYLYYHDGKGNYINADLEAGDNSYRFSGGKYYLTQKAFEEKYNDIYDIIKRKCNDIFMDHTYWCSNISDFLLSYDEQKTYRKLLDAINTAITDGYIMERDINNYVCFGSNNGKCPVDNLYRIIGIFKNKEDKYEAKLIKATYASSELLGTNGTYSNPNNSISTYLGTGNAVQFGTYKWAQSDDTTWNNSEFNLTNLNDYFLSKIGNWQDKISNNNWHVGSISPTDMIKSNAKTAYETEVLKNDDFFEGKMGLMYVSDYYYAASPEFHSKIGWTGKVDNVLKDDYRLSIFNNWLYLGIIEPTLTTNLENSGANYTIDFSGVVGNNIKKSVVTVKRPVFYLNHDVKVIGGAGTMTNPYLLR